MQLKREIVLIAFLLLTIVVLVRAVDFFSPSIESADAAQFVLEDLKVKYPDAEISILKTEDKVNSQGDLFYEVKAKVTQGPDSPCPRRVHIYYNYPVQNFVPQPAEVITDGCRVCEEGTCVMLFAEEAIIASHTFEGTKEISTYIVQTSAKPIASDMNTFWRVRWDSADAAQYFEVDISKDGKLLNVTKTLKDLN